MTYQLNDDDLRFCEMVVCAGGHAIKHHTLQVMEELLIGGVEGDFAECGVLYGAHPAIMLRSLQRRGIRSRKVHLFDSFQGIPHATREDDLPQQKAYGLSTGPMESSGVSISSIDNVMANFRKWDVYDHTMIEIHAGWFQDSLPGIKVAPLALLRVDVDLCESTRMVYENLYQYVVPGGYVIDDDWGAAGEEPSCRRVALRTLGASAPVMVKHVAEQDTTAWWRKL